MVSKNGKMEVGKAIVKAVDDNLAVNFLRSMIFLDACLATSISLQAIYWQGQNFWYT